MRQAHHMGSCGNKEATLPAGAGVRGADPKGPGGGRVRPESWSVRAAGARHLLQGLRQLVRRLDSSLRAPCVASGLCQRSCRGRRGVRACRRWVEGSQCAPEGHPTQAAPGLGGPNGGVTGGTVTRTDRVSGGAALCPAGLAVSARGEAGTDSVTSGSVPVHLACLVQPSLALVSGHRPDMCRTRVTYSRCRSRVLLPVCVLCVPCMSLVMCVPLRTLAAWPTGSPSHCRARCEQAVGGRPEPVLPTAGTAGGVSGLRGDLVQGQRESLTEPPPLAAAAAMTTPPSEQALGELLARKEEEWRALQAQRTRLQEAALREAHGRLQEAQGRLQRLQEDFIYNLQVLEERDRELERYDAAFAQAQRLEGARQAEVSELKVEAARLQQALAREARRLEDLQQQQQRKEQEHRLALRRAHRWGHTRPHTPGSGPASARAGPEPGRQPSGPLNGCPRPTSPPWGPGNERWPSTKASPSRSPQGLDHPPLATGRPRRHWCTRRPPAGRGLTPHACPAFRASSGCSPSFCECLLRSFAHSFF